MNKGITKSVEVAVTVGALAAALTGCCMFGSDNCCDKKDCCCKCCCEKQCHGKKTSGVNTSMTIGVGTDGIHAGGDANVGSHGISAGAGGGMH